MTTALQVFAYDENMIRTVEGENGETLFVAKDIAEVLGYSDTQAMTRRLDDDEVGSYTDNSSGQGRNLAVLNESGLYSAILGSNKTEAKAFKKWITSEVLPTIRKTGGYGVTAEARELALRVAKLEKEAAKAKQIAKKPKPDSVESFISKKIICTSGYSSFTRGVHSKYMDFCRFHRLNPDMRRLQQRLLEVSKGLSEDGFWYMGISIRGERR